MFKKKRLVIYLFSVCLIWVGWKYSAYLAVTLLATAFVLLGLIKMLRIFQAYRGMKRLDGKVNQHYEALINRLPGENEVELPWSFAVLGDTRNNVAIAREIYKAIEKYRPVMAFHTGDIVRGGTADELLDRHIAIVEKEMPSLPLFCIPGNHERGPKRDYAAFKRLYGDDRFSFVYKDCIFTGINNNLRDYVQDDDLAFLEQELQRPRKHRFVFLHIPPAFFEETFVSDTRRRGFTKNAEAFHTLMKKYAVDEVFMAHIHGYATLLRDGVRYTLTAGGGAPLSHRIVKENSCFHFIDCLVTEKGVERTLHIFEEDQWTERKIV
jgi:hypothetical protein